MQPSYIHRGLSLRLVLPPIDAPRTGERMPQLNPPLTSLLSTYGRLTERTEGGVGLPQQIKAETKQAQKLKVYPGFNKLLEENFKPELPGFYLINHGLV
ncbi:MAG: hypothetical protein QXR65_09190 [Candidatus Bathyarchaeia archaeon]|nr:hypothetical protein [Candidatus Bathyarchaeota archaeon]